MIIGKSVRIITGLSIVIFYSFLTIAFIITFPKFFVQEKLIFLANYIVTQILSIIFLVEGFLLLKNKRKFFLPLAFLFLFNALYSTIYRYFFLTNRQLGMVDLQNWLFFVIPAGLILLSYCLEPESQPLSSEANKENPESFSPLQYQGIFVRASANLVDQVIIAFPFLLLSLLLNKNTNNSDIFREDYWGMVGLIFIIYSTVTEAIWGQTLGKKLAKIKVMMVNGEACTLKAAILRNIGRFLDLILGGYLLGILSIILTHKKQRIGDLIAGTVVIKP